MVCHMKDAKSLSHLSLNNAVLYFLDAILDNLVFIIPNPHVFWGKTILTGGVVCLFDWCKIVWSVILSYYMRKIGF